MSTDNSECDHRNLRKEYYLGASTGEYICEDCGESFSAGTAREMKEERRQTPPPETPQ